MHAVRFYLNIYIFLERWIFSVLNGKSAKIKTRTTMSRRLVSEASIEQ